MYYYGARWYDSYLNRFIQPDTVVPNPGDPQSLNRFAYARNNPVRYRDPTGHWVETAFDVVSLGLTINDIRNEGLTVWNAVSLATDVASLALPLVPAGASHAIRAGKLAAKAANAVDTVADAAKTAENVSDVLVTGARRLAAGNWDEAEKIYDVIRNTEDDVAAIAKSTGIPQHRVERVKKHVFYDTHRLDDGIIKRYDADPEIADAWTRLTEGGFTDADLQLFYHELYESRFEGLFNLDWRQAHKAAEDAGRLSELK